MQPFIVGPQCRSVGQLSRCKQVGIDVTDAAPEQMLASDGVQHLDIGGDAGLGQIRQGVQDDGALTEIAESELAKDKGVHQHPSGTEEIDKRRVPAAQMIYPNRRINQDHAGRDRRRGGAFSAPSLPPSRAKRRALSRSISALSASRTKLDFSVKPVKD